MPFQKRKKKKEEIFKRIRKNNNETNLSLNHQKHETSFIFITNQHNKIKMAKDIILQQIKNKHFLSNFKYHYLPLNAFFFSYLKI